MTMQPESDVFRRRLENFGEVLERAGYKKTSQRVLIYRQVARTANHPDAESIWKSVREALPGVSLDTVYRTLGLFIDLGLVSTLGQPRERARFDANASPHHHFVCTSCGLARDLPIDGIDTPPAPQSVEGIGQVLSTHIEFRGLCSNCAALKSEETTSGR
jgi:Fur family peroxide stress response transcriptional regulator